MAWLNTGSCIWTTRSCYKAIILLGYKSTICDPTTTCYKVIIVWAGWIFTHKEPLRMICGFFQLIFQTPAGMFNLVLDLSRVSFGLKQRKLLWSVFILCSINYKMLKPAPSCLTHEQEGTSSSAASVMMSSEWWLKKYFLDEMTYNITDNDDDHDDDDDLTFKWGNIDFNLCHSAVQIKSQSGWDLNSW